MFPTTVLTILGLVFDAAGALLVIVPEHTVFDAFTRPQERIRRIDDGRETLFTEGELSPEDDGFDEFEDILNDHLELHGPLIKLVAADPAGFGGGGNVEVRYEPDGGDAEYAQPKENPSQTLFDRWCERRVRHLERQSEFPFYNWGFRLLFFGFLLQIIAVTLPL